MDPPLLDHPLAYLFKHSELPVHSGCGGAGLTPVDGPLTNLLGGHLLLSRPDCLPRDQCLCAVIVHQTRENKGEHRVRGEALGMEFVKQDQAIASKGENNGEGEL